MSIRESCLRGTTHAQHNDVRIGGFDHSTATANDTCVLVADANPDFIEMIQQI